MGLIKLHSPPGRRKNDHTSNKKYTNKTSCKKKRNKTSYKKSEGLNKMQTTQSQVSLYDAAKMRQIGEATGTNYHNSRIIKDNSNYH